ncbi:DUF7345 domain-containing protein [Natronomonas sp. EA1]|uniref:DUF7345 domain-containing protein n=1 Tax=Natronomonas sp. EA1 TaxID=3421655 RepID=UPI003EBEDCA2
MQRTRNVVAVGVFLAAMLLVATLPVDAGGGMTDGAVTPDSVLMHADVRAGGNASWVIEHRILLDDENATEAFESIRAEIENGTTYSDRFRNRMKATVADAENTTGREMDVADVTVTAERRELPQSYGVVSYRFTWVGFAAVDGDRLRVSGALGGLFLDDDTRFVMSWPATYAVETVAPTPDEREPTQVSWRGPAEFGPSGPQLVLTETETAGTPATEATGTEQPATTGETTTGTPGLLVGGVAAAIAGLAVGGWLLTRRDDEPDGSGGGDETTGDEPDTNDTASLLSSDERVLQLLDERGGRVKQREIATALDWSDARTSQVVTELRERGAVETYRVGRENVVSLSDNSDT